MLKSRSSQIALFPRSLCLCAIVHKKALYTSPPIRGSLPEVIRSWCAHRVRTTTTTTPQPKVFAGRLNARGTRTRLPRRAGGAWPGGAPAARDLGAAATPLARRPLLPFEPPYRCSARAWRRRSRGVPPHPRPRQELEARLAPSLSSSAQHTTSSTSPLPPGDNVRSYAGGTCRRPGAQRPRLRRRARSVRQ